MKKLPIGVQDISEILQENYVYIDKTKQIYDLINTGKTYFLSRPRRFGKSLLCSTLKEIFSGNKELFKDCWIYDSDFKWEKHPVLHMSMTNINYKTPEELEKNLNWMLEQIAKENKIDLSSVPSISPKLTTLVKNLSHQNKVALIIDEYDKPILDHITNPQKGIQMRDILRSFYVAIKDLDPCLKFVFLTGVSKFSKTSIFSGLNNLKDITFRKEFSTICGYTSQEVSSCFEDRIKQIEIERTQTKAQVINEVKQWYNVDISFVAK